MFMTIISSNNKGRRRIIEFDMSYNDNTYPKSIYSDTWNHDYYNMYCFGNGNIHKITENNGNIMYNIGTKKVTELPKTIYKRNDCGVLHSNQHGLFLLGGIDTWHNDTSGILEVLSYDNNGEYVDEWNQLASMLRAKYAFGCVLFRKNNKEYIIECCGIYNNGFHSETMQIYDINNNEWKSLGTTKVGVDVGIGYDSKNETIIRGGGSVEIPNHGDSSRIVGIYNFERNEWYYNIDNTKYDHKKSPIVYVDDNGVIYIAGDDVKQRIDTRKWGCIERYDQRSNHKKRDFVGYIEDLIEIREPLGLHIECLLKKSM